MYGAVAELLLGFLVGHSKGWLRVIESKTGLTMPVKT